MFLRVIKNTVFTGLPFGLFMGLLFTLLFRNYFGVIGGIGCGIVFGIPMAIFAEIQRSKMISKDTMFEGEAVLFQGPANHFRKVEGRGGWLTLTNSCLVFRSHGINIQNQPIDIAIADILEVKPTLTAGFIPNGLRINKNNGEKEVFVVSNRKDWAKKISIQLKVEQTL